MRAGPLAAAGDAATAPDDVDTPWVRVRAGLAELGYVDGQTVTLEARFAHL